MCAGVRQMDLSSVGARVRVGLSSVWGTDGAAARGWGPASSSARGTVECGQAASGGQSYGTPARAMGLAWASRHQAGQGDGTPARAMDLVWAPAALGPVQYGLARPAEEPLSGSSGEESRPGPA